MKNLDMGFLRFKAAAVCAADGVLHLESVMVWKYLYLQESKTDIRLTGWKY